MEVSLAGIVPFEILMKKRGQKQTEHQRVRNYLAELVLDKVVDIKGYGLDQHERILGVVSFKGKNINLEMIRAGLAKVHRGNYQLGLNLEPYQKVEEEARKANRGIWALKNSACPCLNQ
jgi:endonuclease YncB( thermonuclease family)